MDEDDCEKCGKAIVSLQERNYLDLNYFTPIAYAGCFHSLKRYKEKNVNLYM